MYTGDKHEIAMILNNSTCRVHHCRLKKNCEGGTLVFFQLRQFCIGNWHAFLSLVERVENKAQVSLQGRIWETLNSLMICLYRFVMEELDSSASGQTQTTKGTVTFITSHFVKVCTHNVSSTVTKWSFPAMTKSFSWILHADTWYELECTYNWVNINRSSTIWKLGCPLLQIVPQWHGID